MLSLAPALRWHRLFLLAGGVLGAAVWGVAAPEPTVLVDPVQVWQLSPEQKLVAHAISFEGRISYAERRWRHCWLAREADGFGEYLPLSADPPALQQGQRVRIEGTLVPKNGLEASRVRVQVLQEDEPVHPRDATARIHDRDTWWCHVVTVRAYVDAQLQTDEDHVKLSLVVGDQPVIGWVKPADPHQVPDWRGRFIRFTGLYQARFDPTATQMMIEIWTARQDAVEVLAAADEEKRFDRPTTPINQLYKVEPGTEVKIRGRVQTGRRGPALTVRDATGQVMVHTALQQRLPFGTDLELVGTPVVTAGRWTLRSAFYRVVGPPPTRESADLTSVEQIRQLSLEQAARGLPAKFSAVVTWSSPGSEVFFVEDLTSGIRVRYRPEQMLAPPRNKYLEIEGVTYDSGFAPAVELRQVRDLGAMEAPAVKELTYDQAVTGEEDGQLVEIRGFFQRTESEGEQRRIHVMTPGGEFIGLLKSAVNFSPNVGSLVRIRGACEAVADATGRITGIVLRMGSLASAVVESDAPADFFDLPVRSLKSVRPLANGGDLLRVRVRGTVLHAVPGRCIYLEQDRVGLQLLTREKSPLLPGDEIDAVGLLGREGVRAELRETVYRRLGGHPPPEPVRLEEVARLSTFLDSRLVQVRGTLIDLVEVEGRTRLTMQSGRELFEAVFEGRPRELGAEALRAGAGLELTGIYRLRFDDSRQSRSFQLLLRTPRDLVVFRAPQLWTVPRALAAAGLLSGCTLLGLAWVVALRRRVRRQTEQIRAQMENQVRLEAELHRAARLESLGLLAGGIAHDFNNVLTIIMGHLGLALAQEKLAPEAVGHLQQIATAAGRARRLTRQLLTFAKGGDPLLGPVLLPGLVREAFDLALKTTRVRGEIAAPPDLWHVAADKDQLLQAVQNIALNAVAAMPQGGLLRATLENTLIAAGTAGSLPPGKYVRLSLADTGEGIPPEVLPRIFDPYFSTRESASGLGLATVYSIVTKHQGRIEVESVVGQGTTFHLWLPFAEASSGGSATPFAAATAAPAVGAAPAGGARRILFMDDEESIRLIGGIALRRAGYEVVAVPDGEQVLREFEQARAEGRPFDLLILDLTIPGGMGGRETIERLRRIDAAVPAIVSSGYSSDPVMANFASYGFQATVPKPYELGVLLAAIESILGRRAG